MVSRVGLGSWWAAKGMLRKKGREMDRASRLEWRVSEGGDAM